MTERDFYADIRRFNEIYKLPSHDAPALLPPERIDSFRDILAEEVEEGRDISAKYRALLDECGGTLDAEARLELLTDMGDWLGDIVVYCASEARRWGLPLSRILEVIMESNFSKLGADGEPIYDERGKVMKGPGYWKPEPRIREVLKGATKG
jgi:predicted HAD superfamily Cof-like phosphohydrolase